MNTIKRHSALLTLGLASATLPDGDQRAQKLVATWSNDDLHILLKYGDHLPRYRQLITLLKRVLGPAKARGALLALCASPGRMHSSRRRSGPHSRAPTDPATSWRLV